jgi:predicted Fe-Mo cluster-binding NifX family protein
MIVCVTSKGDNLDAQLDPRFGRCHYFIFVDTNTLAYEVIGNPNIDSTGGAGIQSGQLMADKKVEAVITGNIGPNAFQALNAAGINVMTGASGTIRDAIQAYEKGSLKSTQAPTIGAHGMLK